MDVYVGQRTCYFNGMVRKISLGRSCFSKDMKELKELAM